MPRGRAKRSGAEEHRVSKGAQEAHQETVGLVAVADGGAGRRLVAKAHHAVERCDEVRIHHPVLETKPAVYLLQLRRHLGTRQVRLVEKVKRLDQCSALDLAVSRNSVRSCGSFS